MISPLGGKGTHVYGSNALGKNKKKIKRQKRIYIKLKKYIQTILTKTNIVQHTICQNHILFKKNDY